MALEEYQNVLYPLISLFSTLVSIFAVILIIKIFRKNDETKDETKKVLKITFSLLGIGYILSSIAEISWDFIASSGVSPEMGFPDLMWVISYLFLLVGFVYFSIYLYKKSGQLSRGLTITSVLSLLVGVVIFYLAYNYIFGFQIGESLLEMILDYFYLIIGSLVFISTVSIYLFFNKIKEFGIPFMFLAIGYIFNFIGDLLFTYYSWNDIYGWYGVTSDLMFLISYIIIAIAFLMFLLRWASKSNTKKKIKKSKRKNKKKRAKK